MPTTDLELIQVLILAVVQGLTEFLPVSSSGHLVLAGEWLGSEQQGLFLPIVLHLGTLLAVLVEYRKDLLHLILDLFRGKLDEIGMIVVATLPLVVVGLFVRGLIHDAFGSARAAAGGLIFTAIVLWLGEAFRRRTVKVESKGRTELRFKDAIVIGLAQSIAIMPGVSRSGSTIATGMSLGLRPDKAARFSFLISIPAILGATVLEGKDLLEQGIEGMSFFVPVVGLLASAIVGWMALRWLLAFVAKGAFRWFSIYCGALGIGYLVFC